MKTKTRHYYLRVEKRKNDVNGNPRDRLWICRMLRDRSIVAMHDRPVDVGYRSEEQAAAEWLSMNVAGLKRFPKSFGDGPAPLPTLEDGRRMLRYSSGAGYTYAGWLARYQVRGIRFHRI